MCLSDCCRCASSLYRVVHAICILDLMLSVIFVSYETRNFGMLTGLVKYDQNCTNCTILSDFIPKKLYFRFETFTVMTLIILIFVGFIIEGFLYSRLKTGKRGRIHLFCKKWFEIRLALLLLTVFMALAKAMRGFYEVNFDGIIDGVTKTYRIITLYVIKCYMRELEETVGVVYIKPPKPRKRGSLSLK